MLIGYARVSTADQNPDLQLDALQHVGCVQLFTDHASGARASRPALTDCLTHLRSGDTLVVWALDRLGRNVRHLCEVVGDLRERGVDLRSLREGIDTATPLGRLFFHVCAAFAEFELEREHERTHAGLAAAHARGRHGGRRRALDDRQLAMARQLYSGGHTMAAVAAQLRVSRATLFKYGAHRPAEGTAA